MRKAIVTIAFGSEPLWRFTHPLMRLYARKTGADFIRITGGDQQSVYAARLRKLEIFGLFEKYDRILYLDGDVAVNPACPDLFRMVPEDKLGAVREKPPFSSDRREVLREACDYYDAPFPYEDFEECVWFNSGVLVLSKCHQELFRRPEKVKPFGEGWIDMPLLNSRFLKYGHELHELDLRFNYMGSLVSHKARPFEPVDAYMFHATGFLRLYRLVFLKLVIWFWLKDRREGRKKTNAYRRHPLVLSYRIYEALRSHVKQLLGQGRSLRIPKRPVKLEKVPVPF